jgi:hypothetical protein
MTRFELGRILSAQTSTRTVKLSTIADEFKNVEVSDDWDVVFLEIDPNQPGVLIIHCAPKG